MIAALSGDPIRCVGLGSPVTTTRSHDVAVVSPVVNADTTADLIRQPRITRNGEPNKQSVTYCTYGIPISKREGRR